MLKICILASSVLSQYGNPKIAGVCLFANTPIKVIQLYMHTKVFSTKVVSMHRASDTEPRNHQNLWGKPLLKKLDDETQKKVRVQT